MSATGNGRAVSGKRPLSPGQASPSSSSASCEGAAVGAGSPRSKRRLFAAGGAVLPARSNRRTTAAATESASHGGELISTFQAFADVDYNPEDPPSAYNNAIAHSHRPDWDPNTKDLDGEIVMRVGGGKKHVRYWIGDNTLDTTSTPILSQIRARRASSAPPICPRPSAAQIQIEQVQAQLQEEMEAKLEEMLEEHRRRMQEMLEEHRRRMQEMFQLQMVQMYQYMQSLWPLPPLPPGLFPSPPPTVTPNQSTGYNNPTTPNAPNAPNACVDAWSPIPPC